MWCADPYLSLLKSFGYCPIRLPKSDVSPLQVLASSRRNLDRLGELTTLLVPGETITPPRIEADLPAPSLSGKQSGQLSVGVGLSILGTFLGAMGGSKLGLDVSYRAARSLTFEFEDVLRDRIEVLELDQYLTDADVNPFSRFVARMLEADALFVTTETIKSNKLTVVARDGRGRGVSLKVPEIKGIVGGNVDVSAKSRTSSRITYEGKIPLVFGFQAVQLFYQNGHYMAFRPLESGEIAMRSIPRTGTIPAEAAETQRDLLQARGPFLHLDE